MPRDWRDIDGVGRSCHSWHWFDARKTSAMATLLMALALLTLTAWLGARLYDWIRTDGLGHRSPPPSAHDWTDDTDPYLR